MPKISNIILKQGYLLFPLIAIVYMLVKQQPPMNAALAGIVVGVVVAFIAALVKKDGSFTYKSVLQAMESGAKGALGVACACACAGMIVGVVTLTGFGLKIAEVIVKIAQGRLIPTLILTMVSSIILGMGLPTTAKYIVLATMAVPAITKLGVNLMCAHLFILYFGVVADVTPPVALAAYAGAGIAGANSMKTGFQAFKLALGAFIIPYIFCINPHTTMDKIINIQSGISILFLLDFLKPGYKANPSEKAKIKCKDLCCIASSVPLAAVNKWKADIRIATTVTSSAVFPDNLRSLLESRSYFSKSSSTFFVAFFVSVKSPNSP